MVAALREAFLPVSDQTGWIKEPGNITSCHWNISMKKLLYIFSINGGQFRRRIIRAGCFECHKTVISDQTVDQSEYYD